MNFNLGGRPGLARLFPCITVAGQRLILTDFAIKPPEGLLAPELILNVKLQIPPHCK